MITQLPNKMLDRCYFFTLFPVRYLHCRRMGIQSYRLNLNIMSDCIFFYSYSSYILVYTFFLGEVFGFCRGIFFGRVSDMG